MHIFIEGSLEIERHILFRDYLRMHPQAAGLYAAVKIEAAQKSPFDIESYMEYKNPVIKELEQRAFEWSIEKK